MSWQGKDLADDAIRFAGHRIGGKARAVREAVIRKLGDRHNVLVDPFTKLSTLAHDIGFTERQTQRAVRFWRNRGVLDTIPGRRCATYVLRFDRVVAATTGTPDTLEPVPHMGHNRYPTTATTGTPHSLNQESNQEGEPRESPTASPPPLAPPLPDDEILVAKEASGRQEEQTAPPKPPPSRIVISRSTPRRVPLPDDFEPTQEDRQMAIAAGHDPDEIRDELADWAARGAVRQADWHATFRCFIRQASRGRAARPSPKSGPWDRIGRSWEAHKARLFEQQGAAA